MLCCAVALMVFGVVRAGWRLLTRRDRSDIDTRFPPPARRVAPGAVPAVSAAPSFVESGRRSPRLGTTLVIGGSVWLLLVVADPDVFGMTHDHATTQAHLLMVLSGPLVAVLGMLVSLRVPRVGSVR